MSYSSARDRRTAEVVDDGQDLMCAARNCPNRWSISSSKLCSAHHWAEPHQWPRITDEQQLALTNRVIDRQRPEIAGKPLTIRDKTVILNSLRAVLAQQKLEKRL